MSIKNDQKFVALLERYKHEGAYLLSAQGMCEKYKYLYEDESDNIFLKICYSNREKAAEKYDITLKHLFKYIDRYVEEEKAKQKAFGRMQNLYEKFNEFSTPYREIIRRTEDDEIWINIANIANFDLRAIRKDIDKELVKINPSIFLISHSGSNISYEKLDKGKRGELTIGFSFIYRKSLTESIPYTIWEVFPSHDDGFIKFYPHKVAKHFSERINEFALQHASK